MSLPSAKRLQGRQATGSGMWDGMTCDGRPHDVAVPVPVGRVVWPIEHPIRKVELRQMPVHHRPLSESPIVRDQSCTAQDGEADSTDAIGARRAVPLPSLLLRS
jgi:hypothetical protein